MNCHMIVHVGRYISVALFEGHLIHYCYFVFVQSSFAQVQVTACKHVLPFEHQLSGLLLLWFGPFFGTFEVQGLQDPSLLGFVAWLLRSPGWVDYQWHLVGRGNLSNHSLCGDFHSMGAQVVQTDRYPGGPQMQLSIGHCQYHHCRQLGTWHRFCEYMEPHTVSFDTGIGMHTYCVEWGYGDLLYGVDWAFKVIKAELPHLHGSPFREEWPTSSSIPILPELVQVSYSDPDMTAPKWVCIHTVVTFVSSPLVIKLRALSIFFRTNHDWDHLGVGLGWYGQQQHILIIVFDPWDLEVDLHKPKVWDGCNPIPSSSNNWPNGWIVVEDHHKTGSSHWKPECPNQLVQSFPVHLLSQGPHWSILPNRWWGQDWGKGQGQPLVILSFVPLWVWSVLLQGQGKNAGGPLLAVVAGASGGLGHIPSVPPGLV